MNFDFNFFPARLAHFQKFEKGNYAENAEQQSQSTDDKLERMERSRAGDELKSLVNRIGMIPRPPKGYENGWSNSWESWLTKPETKMHDINQTIDFIKDLANKHIRGVKAEKYADQLAKDPNLSLPAKLRLAELRRKYEDAKGNEGKAGSEQAKLDFEEFVTEQIGRQQVTKMQVSEYDELASLPGMKETAQGLTLATSSEKGFSGILQGLIPKEKFVSLNSEQKKAYLNLLKAVLKNAPEGNTSVDGKKQRLLGDAGVPSNWKEWLRSPNDPKWGLDKNGKRWTAASIAEWIEEELPNLKLSTGRYERILTEGHHTINKNGIGTKSIEEFQKLSRSERNEYLDSLQNRLSSVDKEFAERMETAKVTEGAAAKTIGTEMQESAKKQEEKVEKRVTETGKQLKNNSVMQNLRKKFADKKTKLAQRTQETELTNDATNMRQRSAEGGASPLQLIFANTPIAKFFGGGNKKGEAANDDTKVANDNQSRQQQTEQKRVENEAANQVVAETMGDGKENKGDATAKLEVRKIFGLTAAATEEDTANVMKFLITADFERDPKGTRETLNDANGPFRKMFQSGKSTLLDDEPQAQQAA
jgi:hypothetical protein